MHLALPPPRRPDQIVYVERDGGVYPDSPTLRDGLAASAGLSVAGQWSVRSAVTPPPSQVESVDHPVHYKRRISIARDSVRDSVIEV